MNIFERFGILLPACAGGLFEKDINLIGADSGDGELRAFLAKHYWEEKNDKYQFSPEAEIIGLKLGTKDKKANVLRVEDGKVSLLNTDDIKIHAELTGEIYSNYKRCPGDEARSRYIFEDGSQSQYTYNDLMAMAFNCLVNDIFSRTSIGPINADIDFSLPTLLVVGRPSGGRWPECEKEYREILKSRLHVEGYDQKIEVVVVSEAEAAYLKHLDTRKNAGNAAPLNEGEHVLIHDNGSCTTDTVAIIDGTEAAQGETSYALGGGDLDGCILKVLLEELDAKYGAGNYAFKNPGIMRLILRMAKENYYGELGLEAQEHTVKIELKRNDKAETYKFYFTEEKMRRALEEIPVEIEQPFADNIEIGSWKDAYINGCQAAKEALCSSFPEGMPDRLILTGGVSVMPEVQKWAGEAFGIKAERDDTPSDSVAYGLARKAMDAMAESIEAAKEKEKEAAEKERKRKQEEELRWKELEKIGKELLAFEENGKYGFRDSTNVVIPCKWDHAWGFSEGLASVKSGGKWGFIDATGREVIPCEWDYAAPFSEGLAKVTAAGKDGFIDKTGCIVSYCQWDVASSFSEGLARVASRGKHGFIDKTGCLVIPCEWDRAWDFSSGEARVMRKVEVAEVSVGKTMIKHFLRPFAPFNPNDCSYKIVKKEYYIDRTGKIIREL